MNLTKRINNEKLPEIPFKKQSVYRHRDGGAKCVPCLYNPDEFVCDQEFIVRQGYKG